MITPEDKAKAIELTRTSKTDVGSPQVQASILTARIKEITEHLKQNKHDHMARRGLMQMVGQRKKMLKYLNLKILQLTNKLFLSSVYVNNTLLVL